MGSVEAVAGSPTPAAKSNALKPNRFAMSPSPNRYIDTGVTRHKDQEASALDFQDTLTPYRKSDVDAALSTV
jgi:hypothetical protein